MTLICCLLLSTFTLMAQQYTLLVGTYTKGRSEGIYVYDFQPNDLNAVLIDCCIQVINANLKYCCNGV